MISWKRQPTSLKVKTLSKWIVDSRQSQGHHQRSWEQCGYRAAHLHHGWSICPLKSLRSNDLFNEALLALGTTWKYLYQNSNPSLLPFCSPIFWWNLTNQHKLGPDFAWAQQPPHLHQRHLLCRMVAGSQGTSRPYSAFLRWKNILSTGSLWVVCRCFLPTKMEHHHQPLTELHKKTAQCGRKAEEKVVEATAVSILWGTQYVHIVVVPANEALDPSKIPPNRCSRLGTDVFLLQLKSDQELCLYHVYPCVKRPWRGVLPKVVVRR